MNIDNTIQGSAASKCKNQKNKSHAGDAGSQVTAKQSANLPWSKPKDLKFDLLPVKPFEAILLPESIRDYVLDNAHRLDNTAPDFTAMAVIVSAASILGGSVEIQPKEFDDSWTLIPTLWGAAVSPPSAKKSPSLNNGTKLVDHVQKLILDKTNTAKELAFEMQSKITEEQIEEIKSEAEQLLREGKTQQATELLETVEDIKIPLPEERRVLVNDITPAQLVIRLSKNPKGILFFRDELSGLLSQTGKSHFEEIRPILLEGFNASNTPYLQERVGREDVYIPRLIISMLGGIQPDLLVKELKARDSGQSNDGLLERLIQFMVYPDHNQAKNVDKPADEAAKDRTNSVFEHLARLSNSEETVRFSFSAEAQKRWNKWSEKMIEKEQTASSDWQAIYGKYRALAAKVALVLHLIEQAGETQEQPFNPDRKINFKTLEMAFKWVSYLESHAKRIIHYGKRHGRTSSAQILLDKLPKLGEKFTCHQLSQKGWGGLKTKEDRDMAITTLIECGYLHEQQSPKCLLIHPDIIQR